MRMVISFLPIFSSRSEKRLLALCKSNTEDQNQENNQWNKNAVQHLVKKLRKNLSLIDELERAISQESSNTKCVLIPKSTDYRLLISHRRGLPQVIYCRLWRWPDLQSHHQIKAIPTCESYCDTTVTGLDRPSRLQSYCVNPYHYERKKPTRLEPVLVPCARASSSSSASLESSGPSRGGTRCVPSTVRLSTGPPALPVLSENVPLVEASFSEQIYSNRPYMEAPQSSCTQVMAVSSHQQQYDPSSQQQQQQSEQTQENQQQMLHNSQQHHHQQQLQQVSPPIQFQQQPQMKPACQYQQSLQYPPQQYQQQQSHQSSPRQAVLLPSESTHFEIATPYRFKQPRFSPMPQSMQEQMDTGRHSSFQSPGYSSSQSAYSDQQQFVPQQQQLQQHDVMLQYTSSQHQHHISSTYPPQPRYPLVRRPMPVYHTSTPRQQIQPNYQQHEQDVSMTYEATQVDYYNMNTSPSHQLATDPIYDPSMQEQYIPDKVYQQQPSAQCMHVVTIQEPISAANSTITTIAAATTTVATETSTSNHHQSMEAADAQLVVGTSVIDFQEIPYVEGTSWCSIDYHEYSTRVGDKFNSINRIVSVDGYTHPLCTDRFCIGGLSNINRNEFTEWVRRRIGRGIKLTYIDGQVYVDCLSECSVFVSSPLMSYVDGQSNQEIVTKVTHGASFKVFDNGIFSQFLSNATSEGFEAVYKLTSFCSFRVSFVKGWGPDYKRQTISNAPCWIEVQLNGPLQWIDKVLRQMKPPLGCGSTS